MNSSDLASDSLMGSGRLTTGAIAWSLLDAARNPYGILIQIYVFVPYVSSVLIGDPVRGQETISNWAQAAGWIVMLTAPLFGVSIDRLGPRKPWLGPLILIQATAIFSMWWGAPNHSGLNVPHVMMLILIAMLCQSYSEMLQNTMLVRAAGLRAVHKVAGLGMSIGAVLSVSLLISIAWGFALPGHVAWRFVPSEPLFGLNRTLHEQDRIAAPIAAFFLLALSLPFFLFTPDAPRTGHEMIAVLRQSPQELWKLIKSLRGNRDAAIFLLARMFYYDGMTALLLYFGIYAAGVMGWSSLQLLFVGMILMTASGIGGLISRVLDAVLGPKQAIAIQIILGLICITGLAGMSKERILFFWDWRAVEHAPVLPGFVFATLPELIFLLLGLGVAISVTAQYASSRTLLTRLTPPERTGAYFGLFSLSGTATTWLGSMFVSIGTTLTGTQQGGFVSISLLLVAGLIGLMFIRGGKLEHARAQ